MKAEKKKPALTHAKSCHAFGTKTLHAPRIDH